MNHGTLEGFKKTQELLLALYELIGKGLTFHQFLDLMDKAYHRESNKTPAHDIDEEDYNRFLEKQLASVINSVQLVDFP